MALPLRRNFSVLRVNNEGLLIRAGVNDCTDPVTTVATNKHQSFFFFFGVVVVAVSEEVTA